MKRLLTIAASLALLATPLAAQARGGGFHGGGGGHAGFHGGGYHGGGFHGGYRGYRGGYGWGYGAAGFGLGVLAGSALAAPYYDDYYDYPAYPVYAQPAYGYAPAPQQCGQWVWNPQANQYAWTASACQ